MDIKRPQSYRRDKVSPQNFQGGIKSFLSKRHANLYRDLKQHHIGSYLISKPTHIQYLLGLKQVNRYQRELFILVSRQRLAVLYSGLMALPAYVRQVATCHPLSTSHPLADVLKSLNQSQILHADFDDLTILEREHLQTKSACHLVAIPPILTELRQVKDKLELAYLIRAGRITSRILNQVIKNFQIGMREIDITNRLKHLSQQLGAIISPEFEPIVAVGSHSAIPHHRSGHRKIRRGDVVLVDFGCQFQGYWADMTRTVTIGPPGTEFVRVDEAVKRAYQSAFASIIHSKDPILADTAVTNSLVQSGFTPMPHTTGHGLGLAVHELPSLNRFGSASIIKNQTVFTIEPGIYLPKKFGIRYENTLALVDGELITLTA